MCIIQYQALSEGASLHHTHPPAKKLKLSRIYDNSNLIDDDSDLIVDADGSASMGGRRSDAPSPPLSSRLPLPAAILDMFKEKGIYNNMPNLEIIEATPSTIICINFVRKFLC